MTPTIAPAAAAQARPVRATDLLHAKNAQQRAQDEFDKHIRRCLRAETGANCQTCRGLDLDAGAAESWLETLQQRAVGR